MPTSLLDTSPMAQRRRRENADKIVTPANFEKIGQLNQSFYVLDVGDNLSSGYFDQDKALS